MVFHHRIFKGHVIARLYFCYNFLPVYVFLLMTSLRIVLQVGFDLQTEIINITNINNNNTPIMLYLPHYFSYYYIYRLCLKWIVLLLLSTSTLLVNMVFIRFMFDSLPNEQNHPKMRKNALGVLRLLQKSCKISPKIANRCMFIFIFILIILPPICYKLAMNSWHCNECDQDTRISSWKEFWVHASSIKQPLESSKQCISCDYIFKGLLTYFLVVWQCSIIYISMYTRPNIYTYIWTRDTNSSAIKKLHASLKEQQLKANTVLLTRWHPLIKSAPGSATDDNNNFDVDLEVVHHHVHMLGKIEQTLVDDENWQFVIGDGAYAGLIMSTFYIIVLSLFSDAGVIEGLRSYLIISSSQVTFYAFIWFCCHMCISLTDAIHFTIKWIKNGSKIRNFTPIIFFTSVAILLQIVYDEYDKNLGIAILVLVSIIVIFPMITFVGHKWVNRLDKGIRTRNKNKLILRSNSCPYVGENFNNNSNNNYCDSGSESNNDNDNDNDINDDKGENEIQAKCYGILQIDGRKQSTHQQSSPIIRYRIYGIISMLLLLVISITLVSTIQRFFYIYSDKANLIEEPPSFFLRKPEISSNTSFSVVLEIQNVSLASGHLLLRKSNNSNPKSKINNNNNNNMWCKHQLFNVSLSQYLIFTQLAYLNGDFDGDFEIFRNSLLNDFILVNRSKINRYTRERVIYYELYNQKKKIHVITIRGTQAFDLQSWLADIDIWLESAAFQLFSYFLPGLSWWEPSLLSDVFSFTSMLINKLLPYSMNYYGPVIQHVQMLQSQESTKDHHIVLVGHSLGGGIAKISSKNCKNCKVISLSGPGIIDSIGKFNLSLDSVSKNFINIIPQSDLVARIGIQGGTVINVPCVAQRFDMCHMPMITICEFLNECGLNDKIDIEMCKFEAHSYHAIAWRIWNSLR